MGSSVQARRGRSPEAAGFTLLAILVVLAALTLVVGMALQRGEDERRSAILVKHDALALSAAELGLDRSRAYLGAILDKEGDLDKALDPLMNTNCESLANFNPDAGLEDDNLPVIAGGVKLAYGGQDRPFLLVPYDADGDAGFVEGAYLIRFDDNDDDGPGLALNTTTGNNVGAFKCKEGPDFVTEMGPPAKTNTARDRDRSVMVTVVGISPGTDVTRAQARKVLRARIGSAPSAGLITGGSIELNGASHVCGPYGSVSVNNGGFDDGCVCGKSCGKGPAGQSCGEGNACNVQVTYPGACNVDFGGGGGSCTSGTVPPTPKVEVWSKINAPPACTTEPCTPFYYLRADNHTGVGLPTGLGLGRAQVFMWDYAVCPNPQFFDRIHYPGEAGSLNPLDKWNVARALLPTGGCWRLVYDGNSSACADDEVRMADEDSLTKFTPFMQTPCDSALAPVVWKVKTTADAIAVSATPPCDSATTPYPDGTNAKRYRRNHIHPAASVSYAPATAPYRAPIPRGVWLLDGNLTLADSTPGFTAVGTQPAQRPITLLATGNVEVSGGASLALPPAHRGVSLLAGRDMALKNGNTEVLTCGNPASLPAVCPSAAILVHEQFSMGANQHVQGQLVVQNAGQCSGVVTGKAVQTQGNSTFSVPAMPPIYSPGTTTVLSWGEGSF
ncbi:hypothetical protein [Archangium sp.]|uniref:type II secretion system protein n=1 Tax=Archangium sp. TaxID=1872627 RepID=UPI00286A054F|nr:hypothetical protein [Archangium sp.]